MALRNVFWDAREMQDEGIMPSILAIGDSWFWYPFPGGSLVNRLGKLVESKEHNILAVGHDGAEAFDYVFGKHEKNVRTNLKLYGDSLSAVFISGGGNDFAGFNDLRPLLLHDCSRSQSAEDCFNRSAGGELPRLMEKIQNSYETLIGRIVMNCHAPGFKRVFVHNYDYAIPSGTGPFGGNATWLKAALDDAKVPAQYQANCIRYILDKFTNVLEEIATNNSNVVVLVNSAGTLAPGDWANELHPTPRGFEKIAVQRWKPVLQRYGLAAE